LYINSTRWEGVPFVIVAGKNLPERRSHVRVAFKRCVTACANEYCALPTLLFQLHGPESKFPFTQRSDGPPRFNLPSTFVAPEPEAETPGSGLSKRTERIMPSKRVCFVFFSRPATSHRRH
jgi:hypothetical protein